MVSRATPSLLAVALQARPPVAVCRILLHKLRACVTQPVSTSLITFYRFSALLDARHDALDYCYYFFFLLITLNNSSKNRGYLNFFLSTLEEIGSIDPRFGEWTKRNRSMVHAWIPRRSVGRAGGGTPVELWLAKNLYHAKHRSDL